MTKKDFSFNNINKFKIIKNINIFTFLTCFLGSGPCLLSGKTLNKEFFYPTPTGTFVIYTQLKGVKGICLKPAVLGATYKKVVVLAEGSG